MSSLDIVIPTKNEVDYLGQLLESLLQQDYPGLREIPIIIADAHSHDGTRQLASSFSDRLNIRVVEGGLPAKARNRGAEAGHSDYILFLDADMIIEDKNFLAQFLQTAQNRHKSCLGVNIKCRQGSWPAKILYALGSLAQKGSFILGQPCIYTMCLLVSRDLFEAQGKFDEKAVFGEDFLFTRLLDRRKVGIAPISIFTTDRRFRRVGYWLPIKLFLLGIWYRHDLNFFYQDHGYWHFKE